MSTLSGRNLFSVYINMAARRAVKSLDTLVKLDAPIQFSRGDTLKGSLWAAYEISGNPPIVYIDFNADHIGITNGSNIVYAEATNIQQIGAGTYPRLAFNLDVVGTALDSALAATSQDFLTCFFEAHLTAIAAGEGTVLAQDIYVIREDCRVYKTAFNPLP